jgi:hypothetical protein
MLKSEALIFLVNSMTPPEKKAFTLSAQWTKVIPAYLSLFNLISGNRNMNTDLLRDQFLSKSKGSSFETTVKYLYKILLDTLLDLRKEQDSYYNLFNSIMKARILYEKSLFEECFDLLAKVIEDSKKLENYYALLLASRLELEYLLALNFPEINEKTLLNKHHKINEILSFIRKINQQSSLYELLKHRMVYIGNVRSQEQKLMLNDLVVSEMSIQASSNLENFEINKLHQLFQANYLISVGDYKSALRSYIELNSLFEKNRHLWHNAPIYYLLNLEGVLDSLRSIKNYEGMDYFIDQLKKLESPSVSFTANVHCLIFLYELFPSLDKGDFISSAIHMEKYMHTLFNKIHFLSLTRQAELSLYAALIYFGNKDYQKAHKFLKMIVLEGKNYFYLPLYRTIRLVNLMILNELKDFDLISYETRSIKREMKDFDKGYRIEKIMLRFLNKQDMPITNRKRNILWEKVTGELDLFWHDIFEQQVLRIFDFTSWIESKIRKIPLNEVLKSKDITKNKQPV